MRASGFRQFTKGDLIKVTRLATVKQVNAEQAYRSLLARFWLLVAAAGVAAFAAGAASAWLALR